MHVLTNRRARRRAVARFRNEGDTTEMRKLITDIQNSLTQRDTKMQEMINSAITDVKNQGTISTELKAALEKHVEDSAALQNKLVAVEQGLAALKNGGNGQPQARKTPGQLFVENEDVKNFLKNGIASKGRIQVVMNSITELSTGDGGAGDLIVPQRQTTIIQPPNRTLTIRNLLPKGRTTSNAIEFVQETGFTNAAAVVAETVQKPESSLAFGIETAPVRTIAHWVIASKQVLADIPQLQSYIDTRLRYGLALVEENELLAGDGTGQHILGLIPQATAFDTSRDQPGDTRIDTVRRAMTQLRIAEYAASAVVLNPIDWESIELTKDLNQNYVWANPRGLLGPTLWGLPVVESTALGEGQFLVGAFNIAAQIWDREDATVDVSTEDRDNFIKNMVTIRAEERLALTVYRPESFITGDFDDIVSS